MDLIGFKNNVVRSAAILTSSYVAGTVLDNCQGFNQMVINYDFTIGSLTDAQIKVEVSTDGTNYYELMLNGLSAGVNTVVPTVYKLSATRKGSIEPLSIATKYIKVSAIGTGTATSSSLAIDVVLSKV
jgi:hypothetical protein